MECSEVTQQRKMSRATCWRPGLPRLGQIFIKNSWHFTISVARNAKNETPSIKKKQIQFKDIKKLNRYLQN